MAIELTIRDFTSRGDFGHACGRRFRGVGQRGSAARPKRLTNRHWNARHVSRLRVLLPAAMAWRTQSGSGLRIAVYTPTASSHAVRNIQMATRLRLRDMLDSRTPSGRRADLRQATDAEPCACGLVGDDRQAQAYNEEAFRYFLEIERKRSEISNRPFLLLLLDLKKRANAPADINTASSKRLFAVLATCVRETDFIGWYHAGSVVGAVLTQHADGLGPDTQETVRQRVIDIVGRRVSADLAARIQVRIYQAPPAVHA